MTFTDTEEVQSAELEIWQALGMDEIEKQMNDSALGHGGVVMGTGQTTGGCMMCDGSSTTAGCNGCS